MNEQSFPVTINVKRPDGSVEAVRVGTAVRTGDGAHAWRGALLAAADDGDAGEIFRAWFTEHVKIPLRHILAEQALKGAVRRDWDIDLATELFFGPIWHRLIAMRGPVPEIYRSRLVDSLLRALAPA